jgi:sulfate transport system ATP-binding protein
MEVADTIVVMNHGKIEQVGSPAEIYDHPATPFVMQFIGEVNILPNLAGLGNGHHQGHNSTVFIRPHDLEIMAEQDGLNSWAVVKRVIHLGWEIQVELMLADGEMVVAYLNREEYKQLQLQPEQTVHLKPRKATLLTDFDNKSEKVIDYSI